MVRSVLIGKGRRVTLDELESVCLRDGLLEMHATDDNTPDLSVNNTDEITTALSSLTTSSDHLSPANTRAVLTLLANFIAQSRIMGSSSCLNMTVAATLAHLVNLKITTFTLPTQPQDFATTLATLLLPADLNEHFHNLSEHLITVLTRIIPLAITALATIQTCRITKTSVVDALAALSVERTGIDPAVVFSDSNFDVNRPHRGMMTSASVLRACTQGSKYATGTVNPITTGTTGTVSVTVTVSAEVRGAIESIPSYHGPAADAIITSLKILELECNCFESLDFSDKTKAPRFMEMDPSVVGMTCSTVGNAVKILLEGCKQRMGVGVVDGMANSSSNESDGDLIQQAIVLSNNVEQLFQSLQTEAKVNCQFIQSEMKTAVEEATKKSRRKGITCR
jgi:hypothetical protein